MTTTLLPPFGQLEDSAVVDLVENAPLGDLTRAAARLRDGGHGNVVSFSPKVFIPLTRLCRDVCHYCTFAAPPAQGERAFMTPEQVLEVARAGERAGCREALLTLGDKPELRYRVARRELAGLGYETTVEYLAAVCALILEETTLLPHVNPGVLRREEVARLREVSVSQGIMVESLSDRLGRKGGVHFGSPDKAPAARLMTLRFAGELAVPFTTGLLIGIGETRRDRIETLLEIRRLDDRYGHIQEVIIQNFRAKPGTRMAAAPEPGREDLAWTIAVARLILGAEMNIQAPPNLTPGDYRELVGAGLNDWGGVSPVTPDHVNPEAPWPEITRLAEETVAAGKRLVPRLPVYPAYVLDPERWLDAGLRARCAQAIDAGGFAREDGWIAGQSPAAPSRARPADAGDAPSARIDELTAKAFDAAPLAEAEIVELFEARGADFEAVCDAADQLRREASGDGVTYVVTRNINYTNVCYFKCQFCAFSKGKASENLRGRPYDLDLGEIARRAREAWNRGATEVCMQGGIHPDYTGNTYLAITRAVKEAVPGLHLHAFSPLEIFQGAKTLGLPVREFLRALGEAGLGTLPGTAAEILDDDVRAVICPDKLTTAEWLEVVEQAHTVGLRSTSTIMFGHVESYRAWARHLRHLRRLQSRTGGITEFVPLPFVPMEAPLFRKGYARAGPTFREAILMHAVARLALFPEITNIQTSWTKMGIEGAKACLQAGANDLGGTLMNESISRAAGSAHGQELPPEGMEALIRSIGRVPRQRTTLYGPVPSERREASFDAPTMAEVTLTPAMRFARVN